MEACWTLKANFQNIIIIPVDMIWETLLTVKLIIFKQNQLELCIEWKLLKGTEPYQQRM